MNRKNVESKRSVVVLILFLCGALILGVFGIVDFLGQKETARREASEREETKLRVRLYAEARKQLPAIAKELWNLRKEASRDSNRLPRPLLVLGGATREVVGTNLSGSAMYSDRLIGDEKNRSVMFLTPEDLETIPAMAVVESSADDAPGIAFSPPRTGDKTRVTIKAYVFSWPEKELLKVEVSTGLPISEEELNKLQRDSQLAGYSFSTPSKKNPETDAEEKLIRQLEAQLTKVNK